MLSSHRQFVRRVDLLDISKGHKGDPLAFYMFSDSMEVRERERERERGGGEHGGERERGGGGGGGVGSFPCSPAACTIIASDDL